MVLHLLKAFPELCTANCALARLIYLFFEYFSKFNYQQNAISNEEVISMPHWHRDKYGLSKIVIVDPTDIKNNVSYATNMENIRSALKDTFDSLQLNLNSFDEGYIVSMIDSIGKVDQRYESVRDEVCLDWLCARDKWEDRLQRYLIKSAQFEASQNMERIRHDDSSVEDDDEYFNDNSLNDSDIAFNNT